MRGNKQEKLCIHFFQCIKTIQYHDPRRLLTLLRLYIQALYVKRAMVWNLGSKKCPALWMVQ